MAFQLDPSLDETEFKAEVAAKRAAGKKVVLSLGDKDGTVSLARTFDSDSWRSTVDGAGASLRAGALVANAASFSRPLAAFLHAQP